MDADLVRLILLILGIALVAGIWLWDRWQRGRGKPPMAQREQPADQDDEPEWDEVITSYAYPPQDSASEAELDVSIYLQPDDGKAPDDSGPEIVASRNRTATVLPPVDHEPAWVQPAEPVIPAFVMAGPSEPLAGEHGRGEPVLVGAADDDADMHEPTLARKSYAWLSEMTAEPEVRADEPDEPSLEPDDAAPMLVDLDQEPEIPVLQLEPEPIQAINRPARAKPREPAEKSREEADPVSIRMDEDQIDLDLGFSAVDDHDLQEATVDLPDLIVQINIVAKSGQFSGEQILAAMDQVEMQAGEHNIFHRRDNRARGGGKPKVLFSLASLVEPGSFPLKKMKDFSTPGLTLFTQLPGPRDGLLIYSDMLYVAERLARLLDARLKDDQRSTLTKQTIEHTRERIAEHKRQITLKLRQAGDKHQGRR